MGSTRILPDVLKFTKLTHLTVLYHNMTSIDDYVFPSSLKYLRLSVNDFTTISTPIKFSDPTKNDLEELYLNSGYIASIARDAFKNLKQLRVLNLDDNRLTRLPVALQDLTNLRSLHIHSPWLRCTCDVASPLSTWFKNLPQPLYVDNGCGPTTELNPKIRVVDFLANTDKFCPTS